MKAQMLSVRLQNFRIRIAIMVLGTLACIFVCLYLMNLLEEDIIKNDYYSNALEELTKEPSDYPILIWWTPFTGEHGIHKRCGNEICYFTDQRKFFAHNLTMGFLFYGTDFKPTDLPVPRTPQHHWALLHEESPKNNYLFSTKKVMELFNHTSTFRQESDLPLTLQYLDNLDSLTSQKYYIPTKVKNSWLKRLAPVLYVQSDCDPPSDRDLYVTELMKHIKVDSYGKCLHNKDLPPNLVDPINGMNAEPFFELASRYKFTLALENAVCNDYITEKLWRPLVVGSIPVYYGSPTVRDWLPNSKSAITVTDFPSPKHLAEYLHHLNSNDTAYEAHMHHKIRNEIGNQKLINAIMDRKWGLLKDEIEKGNFIEHFECLVCKRISDNMRQSKRGQLTFFQAKLNHYGCPEPISLLTGVPNPESWWLEMYHKAQHEADALEYLLSTGINFTSEQFYRKVISLLETDGVY